jgi:hypothetical protein
MRMISGTEYVLSGPHDFCCNQCQLDRSSWLPMQINSAVGPCRFCGKVGFNQVRRIGSTPDEKAQAVGCLLALLAAAAIAFYCLMFR